MPPPKPLASQADFDEAVSTNVEDFDMNRAEAVVAALEELKLQVRKKRSKSMTGVVDKKTSTAMMLPFRLVLFFSHDSRATAYTKHSNRARTSPTLSLRGRRRWRGEDGDVKGRGKRGGG